MDTRANPNSWKTHLVRKRWDIGLLRALNPRIMMMMMNIASIQLLFQQIIIILINSNFYLHYDFSSIPLSLTQGRRPRGDWGDGPPKNLRWGDGPCTKTPCTNPNILRSSVVGWARKFEESKKVGVAKEFFC